MDAIDNAQAREMRDRDLALLNPRLQSRQGASVGDGICVDCREPIDSRRLVANPLAHRCIGCQSTEDRRMSRFARRGL